MMTTAVNPNSVTVVIPVLNEVVHLPRLLAELDNRGAKHIVFCDGGSTDGSFNLLKKTKTVLVEARGGRGPQLRKAIDQVTTPYIWVVHADSRLPDQPWVAMSEPLGLRQAGAFAFRIDHPAFRYRIIEIGAWLRNIWTGIPYGDQGIFFSRELYDQIGGFEPIPIMEDIAFGQAVKKAGKKITVVRETIATDARRWERDGVLRRTLKNWSLAIRFQLLGVSASRLAGSYLPEPQ